MPEGQVLEFTHVTKRFNEVTAVSDFSARVEPGAVTAFLGPNGAGKTTTLRILLGQVRATSGTATIGGTAYAELRQPLRTIGAVLEETVYRPRRTAERQLTIAAKANGIPLARVGEVLSLVGLEGEGDSRIGGFSLGMRQRLSVAHALLGDPGALVFDEPANGLDPEGIRWMRLLMRRLADEGRTVLVSSHVLSEVEQVADNVLVLSKGQLILASGIETLADPKGGSVVVDAADRGALTTALSAAGFDVEVLRSGLTVRGGDAGTVGAVAADAGIALSTLVQRGPTLEDVFIDLMRGGRLSTRADSGPAQPIAAVAAVADSTADDTDTSDDTSDAAEVTSPPAPVESVVAIPVAAAAAWAAEAAAAPADEALADDLAESVTADTSAEDATAEDAPTEGTAAEEIDAEEIEAEEAPAEETPAEETPAEEAPAEEAPAEDAQTEEAPATEPQADEVSAEEPPARSFDEILFGSAAPVAAAESTNPVNDDAETDEHAETPAPSAEDAADPDVASDAASDEDHAGVEIFADLDAATSADEGAESSEAEHSEGAEADEVDPRSAAVTSMLAAAARAYYEDEPKDYPLSADETAAEADSSDEGAHWSVAATGVIDTVPLSASDDADAEDSASEESDADAAGENEGEPTDGEDVGESDAESGDDDTEQHDGDSTDAQPTDGENHHG
ncbi:ATP-binding cassette domain-containing protein [Microbacterium sp. MYb66]|uniref:ATP-binding cassette domain-containing protein n=1 Tax=Microbacterium sp. MYb66 TaxID=1848692 RepID=UPI001C611CC0|nr:ATP-binding cassette domain-containing protein [Microbacterium sp. MYb66]